MEIWKDIKGYEGRYQVSTQGRVYSYLNYKIIKQQLNCHGYYSVILYNKYGKAKRESVHRLVALTFIDNPNSFPVVNHKDENRTNNNVNNLEWCAHKYNSNYGTSQKRHSINRGTKIFQYDLNMNLIGIYNSIRQAEDKTHHDRKGISLSCKTGENYAGFKWRYGRWFNDYT